VPGSVVCADPVDVGSEFVCAAVESGVDPVGELGGVESGFVAVAPGVPTDVELASPGDDPSVVPGSAYATPCPVATAAPKPTATAPAPNHCRRASLDRLRRDGVPCVEFYEPSSWWRPWRVLLDTTKFAADVRGKQPMRNRVIPYEHHLTCRGVTISDLAVASQYDM